MSKSETVLRRWAEPLMKARSLSLSILDRVPSNFFLLVTRDASEVARARLGRILYVAAPRRS
jgi:hypothetical protein